MAESADSLPVSGTSSHGENSHKKDGIRIDRM